MGRKPLDASDDTVRVTLRLTVRTRDLLDKQRGDFSRSEYLRHLVTQSVVGMDDWVESLPEVPPLVNETKPMPKKLKIVPDKVHRHRFEKVGKPIRSEMRGRMQVKIYDMLCECGETREG